MSEAISKGLEGIVIADSAICTIDGQRGILRYRGIDIADLAPQATYEETVYLLWFDELPTRPQLGEFRAKLAAQRELHESVWNMMISFPCWPQPMEALRTAVSALSSCDPNAGEETPEANLAKATYLLAKLPTIMAYYWRHSNGKERVHPNPNLGHAANFLYMLRGEPPAPLEARAMDLALVLMAEHEMNASTFAARVTSSTLSDMYSAITSAIGTLKGPLHGGANARAMEMLLEIGDVGKAEGYIDQALAEKKRLMGFGHRIYKTTDPRAAILRGMLCEMDAESENPHWCNLALNVAEMVQEKKGLYPNVDFFSAPLLYGLGVPTELFTPIFAMSRIAGWTAQVMEQYQDNRLIRPLSRYVGREDREYVPIEER